MPWPGAWQVVHFELCHGDEPRGALHLVDLAGSERLDKSGAVGATLKETQNINKSLSCLTDVFIAKANGQAHVPFRNSKLTHLMQPCLSGQGKTLMVRNANPNPNPDPDPDLNPYPNPYPNP